MVLFIIRYCVANAIKVQKIGRVSLKAQAVCKGQPFYSLNIKKISIIIIIIIITVLIIIIVTKYIFCFIQTKDILGCFIAFNNCESRRRFALISSLYFVPVLALEWFTIPNILIM